MMDYGQVAEILSSGGSIAVIIYLFITDIKDMKKKMTDIESKLDKIADKTGDAITIKDLLPFIKKDD